ncbi:MAG: hypothetical protein JAY72_01455, partial [Candidatus Thiodiazotropha endolucinida]|nr:hypothetical protein [Candidatus Thiodiazotropha taylori]MCW4320322.1 hypothetical protein [Candidatus Thiodiazotropha taylori]
YPNGSVGPNRNRHISQFEWIKINILSQGFALGPVKANQIPPVCLVGHKNSLSWSYLINLDRP